jgi:glycopeptide antibiotics resistance protein
MKDRKKRLFYKLQQRLFYKLQPLNQRLKKLVYRYTLPGFIASIVVVIVVTWFPFEFQARNGEFLAILSRRFRSFSSPSDLIANLILFSPFGFGLACLLHKRGVNQKLSACLVLLFSFLFSSTIEIGQVFISSRSPTYSDILTNGLSGFIGFIFFHAWRIKSKNPKSSLIASIFSNLKIRDLTLFFIAHLSLIFLLSFGLTHATKLQVWDRNFPLLIGNELSAAWGNRVAKPERPWDGEISQLCIADRVIPKSDISQIFQTKSCQSIEPFLLADYQLGGNDNYADKTGKSPDLVWKGASRLPQSKTAVSIDSQRWLQTNAPVTALNDKIRQTSQFTLITSVKAAHAEPNGASIVAISGSISFRNFVLEQNGSDLIVRLRNSLSSRNAFHPGMLVPNVFKDSKTHAIAVAYNGWQMRIYIDDIQNEYPFDFTPEAVLSGYLASTVSGQAELDFSGGMLGYKKLYYSLLFIPLGIFLGLLASILRGQPIVHLGFIGSGLIVPGLLLEGFLMGLMKRGIQFDRILLSIVFEVVAFVCVMAVIQVILHRDRSQE